MDWVGLRRIGPVPYGPRTEPGGPVGAVAMIIIYPGTLFGHPLPRPVVSPCVVGSAAVSVQAAKPMSRHQPPTTPHLGFP